MEYFDVQYLRPDVFIGREDYIATLHAHVHATRGDQGAAVLCGPAGIGKTRIAVEYAYRFGEHYPGGVYYINARRNWSYELAKIAEARGLSPTRPATAPLERDRWLSIAFQRYLADDLKEPILIIFDNIISPREIRDREIGQGLHVTDLKAHLIAITEKMSVPEPFVAFTVPPLESDAVQAIIGTHAQDMQELVGGFPQAAFLLRSALAIAPTLHASAIKHYMQGRDPVSALLRWHHDRLDDAALHLWKLLAAFRRESTIPIERLKLMTPFSDTRLYEALRYLHEMGLVEALSEERVELHVRIRRYIRSKIEDYRAVLPEARRFFINAMHNPAILHQQASQRGTRALLTDVEEIGIACLEDGGVPEDLAQFQRLLEWEVPYLRDWDQASVRVVQQVRERAHHQQLDELRDKYDSWLAHYPHFRTEDAWRYPLNPALLQTYWGHEAAITDVVNIDGQYIITASRDSTLRLWDMYAGQSLREFRGHKAGLNAVALLNDEQLISAGEDCTVRVWHIDTGHNEAIFEGHESGVRALAKVDEQRIVSAGDDLTVRLWHLPTGSEIRVLTGHEKAIEALLVWDKSTLLSASQDGTVWRWNLLTGDVQHVYGDGSQGVTSLARIDRMHFAAGLNDGRVLLWHIESGDIKQVLAGHQNAVLGLKMMDNGLLISCGADHRMKVWNPLQGMALRTLRGHIAPVLAATQTEKTGLVSVSADRTLRRWDVLAISPPIKTRPLHDDWLTAITPLTHKRIMTASADHIAHILDSTTGEVVQRFEGHEDGITALLRLDEYRIISASADGSMRIWTSHDGKLLRVLEGHEEEIMGVVRLDKQRILSLAADGVMLLWDLQNSQITRKLQDPSLRPSVLVAVNQRAVITAGSDHILRMWNVDKGYVVRRFAGHSAMIRSAALMGQTRLVSGGNDKTVRHWSLITGHEKVMEGHQDYVTGVAAIDDDFCVSVSFDRTLRLWDTRIAAEKTVLRVEEPLLSLSNLGGGRIAVGDLAGKLRILRVYTGEDAEWYVAAVE